MTIIAVCGMQREAKIAALGGAIAITGDAKRLVVELRRADRPRGIISMGIAGGLSQAMMPGTCILATEVIGGGKRYATDAAWWLRMKEKLPHALLATVAGTSGIAATRPAKASLHAQTRAAAVDMESHIAGEFARERNIPFAVLRFIADPANAALPPAALVALNANGTIHHGAVLRSVLMNPTQIPALIRTARQSEKAFAELLRCVRLLGNGFAAPDVG